MSEVREEAREEETMGETVREKEGGVLGENE